ncbi:hypothetical protein FC093_05365 [Ilyomonas limi]|uniref:Uncharacterized protein n=1 Tax=Ilyomonas limi TaxID=2575867 RepID=A0A4U3L6W2_9BACT|nr:hypothetical protein [Ilyomonas limi]TKK70179.1 hypothetical protein FC093_05365 [Ilyomonas limi]
MKRIFLILLICAYAVSTMGVGFGEFYCCGKLKSKFITLADNNKEKCTKEGCCKTKYQFLKLKDNHVASADIYLPAKHFAALHFYAPAFITLSPERPSVPTNRSHAPPLYDDGLPLYLSNCIFRI